MHQDYKRQAKRVALDFDWFGRGIWPGYSLSICGVLDGNCDQCSLFFKALGRKGDGCTDENNIQIEPPKGEGWQMWENVLEGFPISPVFKTPEELARWLADTMASSFVRDTATYEQWLSMIHKGQTPKTGLKFRGKVAEED